MKNNCNTNTIEVLKPLFTETTFPFLKGDRIRVVKENNIKDGKRYYVTIKGDVNDGFGFCVIAKNNNTCTLLLNDEKGKATRTYKISVKDLLSDFDLYRCVYMERFV